jgi:integrase
MGATHSTFDVRVWALSTYRGSRGTTHVVRWRTARHTHRRTFATKKLADSFRSGLITATREGTAFDARSGLPEPMVRVENGVSWYEHAQQFAAMKWPRAAPRTRRSTAEALTTVTPILLLEGRGRPSPEAIRKTLYRWSFNQAARSEAVDEETQRVHLWMTGNSRPLRDLTDASVVRQALDALAVTLDGRQAAQPTIARKRAVFYGALRYAVETDRLLAHPMDKVHWVTPKASDEVDRRVVVNPPQAQRLLRAVAALDPAMEAFFACLYYAALRPGEALHLRDVNCTLPDQGWGELLLTGSTQHAGSQWVDGGRPREDRGLKHRGATATRRVPACPALVATLRHHLETFRPGEGGSLFVTRTGPERIPTSGGFGNAVSASSYGQTWRKARRAALSAAEFASPMARRPYDLRHACVSLWLNAGVPATTVAEWAGHSVAVLLRVYATCVDGEDAAARHRIDAALRSFDSRPATDNPQGLGKSVAVIAQD